MASDLYQLLELPKDATPEQIRKAYKKKALATHPDRIPNATPAQKSAAEEQFRKVNNAYEILNDPAKRKEYDVHGVWPPPEPNHEDYQYSRPGSSRQRAHGYPQYRRDDLFDDPFFSHPHHHSFNTFAFTDPFTLFNSVFPEFFPHPSRYAHHHRSAPSFFDNDPFMQMHSTIQAMMDDSMFPSPRSFDSHPAGFIQPSSSGGLQGRWASESFVTSSVNGVTTTTHKRRDFDGNEHITRTFADGRTVHTINGIEQAPGARGYLPQSADGRHSSQLTDRRQMIQHSGSYSAPIPQSPITQSPYNFNNQRSDYAVQPSPPPYSDLHSGYTLPPRDNYGHHNDHHRVRRSSEKYPYPVDTTSGVGHHEGRHHKKRWWPGRA